MAGRSAEPDIPELQSLGWGLSHMALLPEPCGMCHGTREITVQEFTISCPCSVVVGDG